MINSPFLLCVVFFFPPPWLQNCQRESWPFEKAHAHSIATEGARCVLEYVHRQSHPLPQCQNSRGLSFAPRRWRATRRSFKLRTRTFFFGWMCKYQKYLSIFTSHLHIFAWIIMNMHVLIDWVDRSISPSIDPSLHRSIVCLFAGWLNGCFLPFLAFPSSLSLAFPFLSLPFPFPSSLFFSSDIVLVPRLRALWISYSVLHGQRYSYMIIFISLCYCSLFNGCHFQDAPQQIV